MNKYQIGDVFLFRDESTFQIYLVTSALLERFETEPLSYVKTKTIYETTDPRRLGVNSFWETSDIWDKSERII